MHKRDFDCSLLTLKIRSSLKAQCPKSGWPMDNRARNASGIVSSAAKTAVYAGQCRCWNGFTELGLSALRLRRGWRLVGQASVGASMTVVADSRRCEGDEFIIRRGDVPRRICVFVADFATTHK
jgi:hypothetical protein